MCPKCGSSNINTWHSGGNWKAQCLSCFWHGFMSSLKSNERRI